MRANSDRDPARATIGTLIQALTLLVLTWIGFSLANLELAVSNSDVPPSSEVLERAVLALGSLEHRASRTPEDGDRVASPRRHDDSLPTRAVDAVQQQGRTEVPPVSSAEMRTVLPAPRPTVSRLDVGSLYAIARRTPKKTARANVRDLARRFRDDSLTNSARQEILFMTRAMMLERFGTPDYTNLTQSGHEHWNWHDQQTETGFSVTFRGGYVISL